MEKDLTNRGRWTPNNDVLTYSKTLLTLSQLNLNTDQVSFIVLKSVCPLKEVEVLMVGVNGFRKYCPCIFVKMVFLQ
jgi:hypothetical protein